MSDKRRKTKTRTASKALAKPGSHQVEEALDVAPPRGIAGMLERLHDNPRTLSALEVLHLQRTVGNRAVTRLLSPPGPLASRAIQAKLTMGAAHDPYEQEADQVATQMMTMPEPAAPDGLAAAKGTSHPLQRKLEEEDLFSGSGAPAITPATQHSPQEDEELHTKRQSAADSFEAGADFESRLSATRGGGTPLPVEVRAFMEPRFDADFSGVRLHTTGEAAQLNREVSAQAFTHGQDIYLGEGKNDLTSSEGKHLLAHELTHVVQQSSISHATTAASIHGTPVVQRQPAQPAAEVWTKVEKDAYTNIVAAQKELDGLLADFKSNKLKFDDERIKQKLERAFLYLREAWRSSVPVSSHAKLEAAMASYSRVSEDVGVHVVLLPETAMKEDARFWLDSLRWLETRMTPVKRAPAPAQAVTDLRQDMGRQIDNWKGACRAGIGEFVHNELASRIDALSEGNWEGFFHALVGNTVWAAAAFVPAGAPAFAVSMIGIAIASGPTVPKKGTSKGELGGIEDQLNTYIEKIHEKLNKQLPTSAATLLMEHPGVSLEEGLKLFLEASFKPGMIKHNPLMINETAVRQMMRESAAYSLALLKEVSKVRGTTGEIHTSVSWLSPPDYGPKKLAVVESASIGSGAVVKFLRWVPEENEAIALMTQRSQPIGVQWYFFEQQGSSDAPLYLQWLLQHGWKADDGFGLEWFKRKEEKSKGRKAGQ